MTLIKIRISFFLLVFLNIANANQIPGFKLKNTENQLYSLDELKGEKYTIIDFWATWCKPCLKAMPELNNIYNDYSAEGISLIGISVDSPRNRAKVKPFINSMGIAYPVLLDINSEVMHELNITAVPSLLIIDKDNKTVFFHEGYKPGDDIIIRNTLNQLLKNYK